MQKKIGIIAEDLSDIEVLKKLARKLTGKTLPYAHFVGKGCGSIKRKTPGWCKVFSIKGCTDVLLVHDLDRNSAKELRTSLQTILRNSTTLTHAVVIPEEELEAWLLSDEQAIKEALNLPKPINPVHHPETVKSPKEALVKSVWSVSQRRIRYINSVHNTLIADKINVEKIKNKCPSFNDFAKFFGAFPAKKK